MEKENLTHKQHTSFGKLILAKEKSSPIFSFTGDNRFKNGFTHRNPGPKYKVVDPYLDKFKKSPGWRIGTANRKPLTDNEKYEYFNHKDRMPLIDRSNNIYNQTRWTNVKGGAIGNDPRVRFQFILYVNCTYIG